MGLCLSELSPNIYTIKGVMGMFPHDFLIIEVTGFTFLFARLCFVLK